MQGNFVGTPKKLDGHLHIRLLPQIEADPATLWEDMMRLSATSGHQFIAHFGGERDVHQMVILDVTDFPGPEAVFRSPELMRVSRDPLPPQCLTPNFFSSA